MSSPLVDWADGLMRRYKNADTRKQEADPGMVKEANDSFVKKGKASADPKLGQKKKAKRKRAAKR